MASSSSLRMGGGGSNDVQSLQKDNHWLRRKLQEADQVLGKVRVELKETQRQLSVVTNEKNHLMKRHADLLARLKIANNESHKLQITKDKGSGAGGCYVDLGCSSNVTHFFSPATTIGSKTTSTLATVGCKTTTCPRTKLRAVSITASKKVTPSVTDGQTYLTITPRTGGKTAAATSGQGGSQQPPLPPSGRTRGGALGGAGGGVRRLLVVHNSGTTPPPHGLRRSNSYAPTGAPAGGPRSSPQAVAEKPRSRKRASSARPSVGDTNVRVVRRKHDVQFTKLRAVLNTQYDDQNTVKTFNTTSSSLPMNCCPLEQQDETNESCGNEVGHDAPPKPSGDEDPIRKIPFRSRELMEMSSTTYVVAHDVLGGRSGRRMTEEDGGVQNYHRVLRPLEPPVEINKQICKAYAALVGPMLNAGSQRAVRRGRFVTVSYYRHLLEDAGRKRLAGCTPGETPGILCNRENIKRIDPASIFGGVCPLNLESVLTQEDYARNPVARLKKSRNAFLHYLQKQHFNLDAGTEYGGSVFRDAHHPALPVQGIDLGDEMEFTSGPNISPSFPLMLHNFFQPDLLRDLNWRGDPVVSSMVDWVKKYDGMHVNVSKCVVDHERCYCPTPNPSKNWNWNYQKDVKKSRAIFLQK